MVKLFVRSISFNVFHVSVSKSLQWRFCIWDLFWKCLQMVVSTYFLYRHYHVVTLINVVYVRNLIIWRHFYLIYVDVHCIYITNRVFRSSSSYLYHIKVNPFKVLYVLLCYIKTPLDSLLHCKSVSLSYYYRKWFPILSPTPYSRGVRRPISCGLTKQKNRGDGSVYSQVDLHKLLIIFW